ncbi:hypothetical protein CLU79DRAFT_692916 [Phycomyces nitens]|nr:hypothetical protein CLU79DRAFT_692916 [Phycomyces nitens]
MTEKPNDNPVIDPQELFKQFSPTLLFNAPRVSVAFSSTENWYTVAEQTVPTDKNAFWHTIKKWTREPNYAIPPIERAEIDQSSTDNEAHHVNHTLEPFETIQRTLIPKRKSKDAPFTEKIQYYEQENEECKISISQNKYKTEKKECKVPGYHRLCGSCCLSAGRN